MFRFSKKLLSRPVIGLSMTSISPIRRAAQS
jgi:hypothetical protein